MESPRTPKPRKLSKEIYVPTQVPPGTYGLILSPENPGGGGGTAPLSPFAGYGLQLLTNVFQGPWNSTTQYVAGNLVKYLDGVIYLAEQNNINTPPIAANASVWTPFVGSFNTGVLVPPSVPVSGVPLLNPFGTACSVYLTGTTSTVTGVQIGGTSIPTAQHIRVPANTTVTLIYDISAPGAPTITNVGTAGTTTDSYVVTALTAAGETPPSAGGSTATANATLSTTNYNTVTWNAVTNSTGYNVYKLSNGTYQFLGTTAATSLNDQGAALVSTHNPPSTNTAGTAPTWVWIGG